MIKVNIENKKRSFLWLPIVISLVAHFAFYAVSDKWARSVPKDYGSSRVELKVAVLPPEPQPVEIPKEIPKPKPEPKKIVKRVEPKSNSTKVPPKTSEPVKEVFGVTKDSVSNSGNGASIRVGNTLNKEMEKKFTKPEKVAALPQAPLRKKPQEVPIYKLTKTPSFKLKIEPKYPDELRKSGIEGVVQLELLIGTNGKVRKIKVLKAPNKIFALAAVKAAKKSEFFPGKMGERSVPVKIRIPYRFVLDS